MKAKKTIIQLLVLSGMAISLSACGQSNAKQGRVPQPSAGSVSTPLQGYWIGTCNGTNYQESYQFDGYNFKYYDDIYPTTDPNCQNPFPTSTTEIDGTFQLSSQYASSSSIMLTPNNGQQATYEQYILSGNTLQFGSVAQSGSNPNPTIFTLYTGN